MRSGRAILRSAAAFRENPGRPIRYCSANCQTCADEGRAGRARAHAWCCECVRVRSVNALGAGCARVRARRHACAACVHACGQARARLFALALCRRAAFPSWPCVSLARTFGCTTVCVSVYPCVLAGSQLLSCCSRGEVLRPARAELALVPCRARTWPNCLLRRSKRS